MWSRNVRIRYLATILAVLLAVQTVHVEAKRYSTGGSRSSSSSSSSRRTSHTSHSSHTPSVSAGHSNSHADLAKLSYSNYNSQPNRHSSVGSHSGVGSNTHTAARPTSSPIGWNVPKQQGPPPAYSATNPAGGARTNIHEPPPSYKASAPNYAAVSNTGTSHGTGAGTHNNAHYAGGGYRSRGNSTGGFGGVQHTPISATNVQGVQSGYNRPYTPAATYQPGSSLPAGATYHSPGSLPAGATYHPSGSLPAGATYHSPGALPAGATYHSPGALPAGATYHPSGGYPAGATYHSPGALPAGASYHPGGAPAYHPGGATYHSPGALPAGATYYPQGAAPAHPSYYPAAAAVPAGASYIPAGGALPAGATYYAQPPRSSSSGVGFGTGLAAGALGGAILGHVLTPTQTRVIEHAPVQSGGGGGGGNGEDKIIIINNGPPGSVTTTNAGPGTTVINAGGATPTDGAPMMQPQPAPAAPQSYSPLAPFGAPNVDNNNNGAAFGAMAPAVGTPSYGAPIVPQTQTPVASAPIVPSTLTQVASAAPGLPLNAEQQATSNPPTGSAGSAAPEQPPAGGIICVPVRVNEPDPADNTKTIEVEKIACYPAPPPEATTPVAIVSAQANAASSAPVPVPTASTSTTTITAPVSTTILPIHPVSADGSVPLAPLDAFPTVIPDGFVALAPLQSEKHPVLMKLPGDNFVSRRSASLRLDEAENVFVASSANAYSIGIAVSSIMSLLVAIYLH